MTSMYQLLLHTWHSNKIFSRCDKNPSQTYLIIIEELNRANVSVDLVNVSIIR